MWRRPCGSGFLEREPEIPTPRVDAARGGHALVGNGHYGDSARALCGRHIHADGVAIMFDLKRPCVNCPFRKGNGERFELQAARLREIKRAPSFQCHQTVDYDEFDDPMKRQGAHPQQCAGLMAVLKRENRDNQIMQVAQRLGVDLSDIDPKREAYESWAAVLEAHGGA